MIYPANNDVKKAIDDALKFAFTINKQDDFIQKLFRLGHGYHNNGKEYICLISKDFSKYSFQFACFNIIKEEYNKIEYDKIPWLNGGLIYHGPLQDGFESETFSISLTNSIGWSIHT